MKEQILMPAKAVKKARSVMIDKHKENFIGLYLNSRKEVTKVELISLGTINKSIVHPREVFRPALIGRASGIIVLHNHPSGSVEPSEDDIIITNRLKKAGEILGIQLCDHIIFTDQKFKSIIDIEVGDYPLSK